MRLFSDETCQHRQALLKARQALTDVSDRDRGITEAFCDANDAVIKAEEPLKWWQRLDIDHDLHTHDRDDHDDF